MFPLWLQPASDPGDAFQISKEGLGRKLGRSLNGDLRRARLELEGMVSYGNYE